MAQRIGLQAFPRRGAAKMVNGDIASLLAGLATVPFERLIFRSKRLGKNLLGQAAFAEYLLAIGVSQPALFARLLRVQLMEEFYEECRASGRAIPRELRRR